MGEEKKPFGIRLESGVYAKIEHFAKREHRSPANLGEVLLVWAVRQLEAAGDSLRLMEIEIGSTAVEATNIGKATDSAEVGRSQRKKQPAQSSSQGSRKTA